MMPTRRAGSHTRFAGLPTALLLGIALLSLSYVRHFGDMNSAVFQGGMIGGLLEGSVWGTALAHNLLGFFVMLLLLHLFFGAVCWVVACASERAWPGRTPRMQWVWFWCVFLTLALLASNAAEYPGSSLGEHYADAATTAWIGLRIGNLLALIIVASALATLARALWRMPPTQGRPLAIGAAAAVLAFAVFIAAYSKGSSAAHGTTLAGGRPNVILIGVDSLRNDIFPVDRPSTYAPNIDAFLRQSIRFSDAITPLARTYPSWLSILTGEHPHTTGGALNLLPPDMVRRQDALGFVLRKAGYRTVYGIDETRFSNIDASYGFDQIITPPIGASDFLIAWFGDTPLSNLIVNTRLGQWLFPYLHANRGAATTYDPDAYVRRIARELPTDDRPLFLAVHLTLAHWPYVWKDSVESEREGDSDDYPQYLRAVQRVDRQFHSIMAALKQRGVLDNSIVVVLSDHGEAFAPGTESIGPEDSSVLKALDAVPGWGHGTSVLAPDQYRVVLGMRLPDSVQIAAGRQPIQAPVSTEDIAPTLYALLGLAPPARIDGHSLLPLIGAGDAAPEFPDRIRFTESEFTPKGVMDATNKFSPSGVRFAARYYKVDPQTDRLSVRRELVATVLAQRQFAAFTDKLLVAAIPVPESSDYRYILLRNPFRQGGWIEEIGNTRGAEADPEARRLQRALQDKFPALRRGPAQLTGKVFMQRAP